MINGPNGGLIDATNGLCPYPGFPFPDGSTFTATDLPPLPAIAEETQIYRRVID